jgi:hypothetical protein
MSSLRRSLVIGAVAFGIMMALIVGIRLDEAALTVIVGLTCGIGASIPSSLIVVSLLNRRNVRAHRETGYRTEAPAPRVVVVSPPAMSTTRRNGDWSGGYALPPIGQRKFSVIGEEETREL